MMQKFCIITFLLVASNFKIGNSLKCFNCTTIKGQNSSCEYATANPDKVQQETCTGDNTICAKYTIQNTATSIDTLLRSCKPTTICSTLADQNTEYSKLIDCNTCNYDLCDSGNVLKFSLILSLILMITSCKIV